MAEFLSTSLSPSHLHQVQLAAKEPLDRQYEYHSGLAIALRQDNRLAETRASLRQGLGSTMWSDVQRARLLGQLAEVLVRY